MYSLRGIPLYIHTIHTVYSYPIDNSYPLCPLTLCIWCAPALHTTATVESRRSEYHQLLKRDVEDGVDSVPLPPLGIGVLCRVLVVIPSPSYTLLYYWVSGVCSSSHTPRYPPDTPKMGGISDPIYVSEKIGNRVHRGAHPWRGSPGPPPCTSWGSWGIPPSGASPLPPQGL